MEHLNKLQAAIDKGKKEESIKKTKLNPYKIFGFERDPFDMDLIYEFPDLFFNRSKEIEDLGQVIGHSLSAEGLNVAIIGPEGIGKRTLLIYLSVLLLKIDEVKNKYPKSGLIRSTKLFENKPSFNLYKNNTELLPFQFFLENIPFEKLIFLGITEPEISPFKIIDFLQNIEMFSREKNPKLNIFVTFTPALWKFLNENNKISNFFDKILWIPRYDNEYMLNILISRIKQFRKSEFSSLFDETTLSKLVVNSYGIPEILFDIFKECLNQLSKSNLKVISTQLITDIIKFKGYNKILEIFNSEPFPDVVQKLFESIRIYPEGNTASHLSEGLNISRTTLTYHLSKFEKLGYLTKIRKGREVYYHVPKPIRVAFDIRNSPIDGRNTIKLSEGGADGEIHSIHNNSK